MGDIGDNRHERSEISIYRVKEPMIDFSQSTESITSNWQSYALKYSDNQRYNAESMLIDAKTRELLIITKGKLPPYAKVFKTQLDTKPETVGILEDTDIRLTLPEATDASASADGQVVMIRLYVGAFLWPRRPRPEHYKMVDILREEECLTSVGMQRQGESVALNPLGVKYFTHSEFVNQSIWEYAIL